MDDTPGVLIVYGVVLVSYFLVVALVSNLEIVSFVSGWVLEILRCFWVPLRVLNCCFFVKTWNLNSVLGSTLGFLRYVSGPFLGFINFVLGSILGFLGFVFGWTLGFLSSCLWVFPGTSYLCFVCLIPNPEQKKTAPPLIDQVSHGAKR